MDNRRRERKLVRNAAEYNQRKFEKELDRLVVKYLTYGELNDAYDAIMEFTLALDEVEDDAREDDHR